AVAAPAVRGRLAVAAPAVRGRLAVAAPAVRGRLAGWHRSVLLWSPLSACRPVLIHGAVPAA
ncbi:hypothetical protein, partial [Arthrobacter pigmenti]